MTITFERSVGANSDVNELEYIAALMQTEKMFLRKDGSLTARDIHFYLKSRHGLQIPTEQVEKEIICELGGTAILRKSPETSSSTGGGMLKKSSVTVQEDEQPLVESNIEGSTLEEGISVALKDPIKASVNDSMAVPYSSVETEEKLRDEGEVQEEKEKPRLDMAQIASLLLIPKLREIRVTEDKDANNKRASTYFTRADSQEKRKSEEVDMIDGVLAVILKETDLPYDTEVTKDVLRKILSCFNEVWSDEVLETMLRVASGPPDSSHKFVREAKIPATPRLNRATLVRVLTEDLTAYDVDLDNTKASPWAEAASSEVGENEQYASDLEQIYTASNIDANAQTYKSESWHIWVWFCIVTTLFAYLFSGLAPASYFPEPDCGLTDSTLACSIATATQNWIEVFIKLSVMGFPIVYLSTLGNSVYLDRERQRWLGTVLILVAMVSISVYVALPFFYHANFGLYHSEEGNNRRFMAPVSLVTGFIVLCVQFSHFLRLHIPSSLYQRFCCLPCARPSNTRKARDMKEAANYKIDKMIRNALSCHVSAARTTTRTSTRSHPASTRDISEGGPLGNAIVRFQQSSVTQIEEVGGIIWMWKRARDRSLFYEEGVNLFPRLVASNVAQWFVVLIIIGGLVVVLSGLGDGEEYFEQISNDQLRIAILCGIFPALIAAVCISVIYIPSAVTTVLKYRAGINGSLRDRRFLQNRFAMDSANLLFGAAFWTCLCSAGLIAGIIGIFVCLCLYDGTQSTMVVLCSNVIGMLITMSAKQIILLFLRSRWSRGYYRSRPAAVNVSNTIQEVWNLGLTTFSAFVRALKFLAIFLFYLGRIDVQIFAPGIGWFMDSIPLDGLPHCFLRDLLLNEAHRHPLIERLGLIYMLKIRHGSKFGTPGGAAWRMLFTFSLMPWLRRYLLSDLVYLEEKELRDRLGIMSKDDLVDNIVSLEEKYRALSDKLKHLTHEKAGENDPANGAEEAIVQSNAANSLGTSSSLRPNASIMAGVAPEPEREVL